MSAIGTNLEIDVDHQKLVFFVSFLPGVNVARDYRFPLPRSRTGSIRKDIGNLSIGRSSPHCGEFRKILAVLKEIERMK